MLSLVDSTKKFILIFRFDDTVHVFDPIDTISFNFYLEIFIVKPTTVFLCFMPFININM